MASQSTKNSNRRDQELAKNITPNDAPALASSFFKEGNVTPRRFEKEEALNVATSEPVLMFHPVDAVLKKHEMEMPLRQWIAHDVQESAINRGRIYQVTLQKASTLRKVTISYAIAKLLQHLSFNFQITQYSNSELQRLCCIDNFAVRVSNEQTELGWEVTGVDMINPPVHLQIMTEVYLSCNFFDVVSDEAFTGRTIMPNIISTYATPSDSGDSTAPNDESMLCHFLGLLLHGLFSGVDLVRIKPQALQVDERSYENEPLAKKSSERFCHVRGPDFSRSISVSGSVSKNSHGEEPVDVDLPCPLSTIGYSTSLSHVVTDLVDCGLGLFRSGGSYPSLEMAIADLCLLLEEPGRFLFEDFRLSQEGERIISCGKGNSRLYGRTAEAHLITDTFCRVASTGESEAFLIGGFSGCGKTRLVQSVFEAVEAVDGLVVVQKFDEVSTLSPSSVVMSAFNELCLLVAKRSTPQELHAIYENLIVEFGANFHVLARALPNVLGMLSSCNASPFAKNETDDFNLANYSSLCFTLQRFMRVISSASRPIMLFLDDLQWADPASLGLVHAVLSDMKGKSCMLFVGTYRDNEVGPDHIIFGFIKMLSQFNVPTSKIRLDGLTESDVNSMVSDAFRTLPRLCRSLSQVVFRKTNGNPYFVLEFLRSLVHRDIVKFCLRERRWKWDEAKVSAENITDNVLYLLSNKISGLSACTQTALKCASCFGIKIEKSIAQKLSCNSDYINLHSSLDDAVNGGFMDFDGTHYRFVHDKVREAAYDLINADFKDQFHFELGMAMHSSRVYKDSADALFVTIEQINHGVPSLLIGTSHQNAVAELNYEASVKSMHCANFTSAFDYIKAAVSLLSGDSWTTHYTVSLKYYLQLGKAAIPCGFMDEAKAALNKIIDGGKCLEDKIDAYFLLTAMQSCGTHTDEEIDMCVHVLRLLGEDIPTEGLELCQIVSAVNKTKQLIELESDEALLQMTKIRNNTRKIENIMKFYGHLGLISWFVTPKMHAFYMARFAHFCLKSQVGCKYLPSAFVAFGACLCNGLTNETFVGYRIGKIGLMILNRSELDMDEASKVYLAYYRELGVLFEPIQACVDMHRRGYEFGMQVGNTSLAGLHLCLAVHREIISGKKLQLLKAEIEFYLKLARQHSLTALKVLMQIYYRNVLTLIGEQLTCPVQQIQGTQYEEIDCTQEMMSSFFSGHFDRVNYLSKKWEASSDNTKLKVPIRVISVAFYTGLATTKLHRTKGFKSKQSLQHVWKKLLPVLVKAEEFSKWNFKHKASMLKAEYLSLTFKRDKAELEYECAVSSARLSKFIHEEGMACELAGMHYKHHGDKAKALELFCRAQKCYEAWGSQMKVDQMIVHQKDLL
eukprot:CCRYP_006604-RB/>CCRYP_006604-RB protein AED:0.03 eAED:0.03 QI:114/1/1/1/1/1/5/168/1358